LLQEGDVCIYNAFVEKEFYALDEKGNEHIVQFAIEGWWITDLATNQQQLYLQP
jgi:hypothetical protein